VLGGKTGCGQRSNGRESVRGSSGPDGTCRRPRSAEGGTSVYLRGCCLRPTIPVENPQRTSRRSLAHAKVRDGALAVAVTNGPEPGEDLVLECGRLEALEPGDTRVGGVGWLELVGVRVELGFHLVGKGSQGSQR
jgi:hypothetical protein